MKTTILICFLLVKSSIGISQNDSSAYQQFFNRFVTLYKEFSKPPLKNFYEVLSNTAGFSFTTSNPAFVSALQQIRKENKVSESVALDSLFNRVFYDLNANYLWVNAMNIYNEKRGLFQAYNDFFCPCITAKVKRTDLMQKVSAAMQQCVTGLIKDTSFTNTLRKSAGNNTLNDIYSHQQYISFYIYSQCPILNYKFNETIKSEPVYTGYNTSLSDLKNKEAQNVIRYFKTKKMDSLAFIFPGYNKYLPELKKILALAGGKEVVLRSSYYFKDQYAQNPSVSVSCFKNKTSFRPFGSVDMELSEASFVARIITIKYVPANNKSNEGERIEEIRIIDSPVKNKASINTVPSIYFFVRGD